MAPADRLQTISRLSGRSRWLVAYAAATLAGTAWARRRGYGVGGDTVVSCRRGHLFTTWWIPGASVKALRLGWWRYQYCPIERHWSVVAPVRAADLTATEANFAREHHDVRIP
jgi:hypothetical protein